jgi:hypothetical protein
VSDADGDGSRLLEEGTSSASGRSDARGMTVTEYDEQRKTGPCAKLRRARHGDGLEPQQ